MSTSKDRKCVGFCFSYGEARRWDSLTRFWPNESRSGPVVSESDTSSVGSTGHRRKARGILWKPGVMSFPNEIMVRNKSEGQELLISSGQKKKKENKMSKGRNGLFQN